MTIRVCCAQCGKSLKAPDKLAGKVARCPNCRQPVQVPAAAEDDVYDVVEPPPPLAPPAADDDVYGIAPPPAPETPVEQSPRSSFGDSGGEVGRQETVPAAAERAAGGDVPPPVPEADEGDSPPQMQRTLLHPPSLSEPSLLGKYLYFLFALAFIPLAVSLLGGSGDIDERLNRAVEEHPGVVVKVAVKKAVEKFEGEFGVEIGPEEEFEFAPEEEEEFQPETEEVELDWTKMGLTPMDIAEAMPDGKIEGAHLPRGSAVPWLYALLSAAVFFGAIWFLFPRGTTNWKQVLLVALAVATIGLMFLFMVQWIAVATRGWFVIGRGVLVILFYVVKFIGYSYEAALRADTGFFASFVGFTIAVGLCEELTKLAPVLFYFHAEGRMDWRSACMWGLAAGIGFGVAEGIIYSYGFYNGLFTFDAYVVRFVSCVALHAVWTAAAAIMAWRRKRWLSDDWDFSDLLASAVWIMGVPMVLHGLYDTFLKKEMNSWALVAALASFAWLVFLTEWTRRQEEAFFEAQASKLRAQAGLA
jgi:RsiW-degrading membrane proteinase PrsW (M82 family)